MPLAVLGGIVHSAFLLAHGRHISIDAISRYLLVIIAALS